MVFRIFLITSICISAVSYGQKNQKLVKSDSASFYIEAKDFVKAIHFLDVEINNNPSATLYSSRGLAKIETDDLNGALVDLKQSLLLSPKNDTC